MLERAIPSRAVSLHTMTLVIIRRLEDGGEKVAEYHEGGFRGMPGFNDDFDFLLGADEQKVMRTIDGPEMYATPIEEAYFDRHQQLGWFPDPDWEPENPEYKQRGSDEGTGSQQ